MFERLQSLPLLLGLGVHDLMNIVEKVKFAFDKYYDGYTIVNQDDRCDKIVYVLRGELCAYRRNDENGFHTYEYFTREPYVIEPQNIWGMHQKYEHTYSFTSEGSTCCIEKRQLTYLISKYEIVRTNFLSMICNKLQYANTALRDGIPSTTSDKLKKFIKNNKIIHDGITVIKIKMDCLAELISDTRLNVSRTLNTWQSRGIIELYRGGFKIKDDAILFG